MRICFKFFYSSSQEKKTGVHVSDYVTPASRITTSTSPIQTTNSYLCSDTLPVGRIANQEKREAQQGGHNFKKNLGTSKIYSSIEQHRNDFVGLLQVKVQDVQNLSIKSECEILVLKVQ